jgi:hypothetical protein
MTMHSEVLSLAKKGEQLTTVSLADGKTLHLLRRNGYPLFILPAKAKPQRDYLPAAFINREEAENYCKRNFPGIPLTDLTFIQIQAGE